MKPISALVGVTLETPNPEIMSQFYTAAYGLESQTKSSGQYTLKGSSGNVPQLTLRQGDTARLVGITLAMRTVDDLNASAAFLEQNGVNVVEAVHEGDFGQQFSIKDPDGNLITFLHTTDHPAEVEEGSDRPLFVSHAVLNSLDAPAMTKFYTEVLGFEISDKYENDLLIFLKCDQPQHHCLGISPGESAGLNHFAMDCGSLDALMKSVGRMQRLGYAPVWGPGRHGPGGNVFCYYQDPDGFVPEFTCDVLQIEDPENWEPKEWARTPENGNVWGTGGPTPRAVELMSGAAKNS